MYEDTNNPELCPVSAFELYLSKLHPSLDSLWQRHKSLENFKSSDDVWYCNAALGKNTLGSFMKTISDDCELSREYTNHCIRATAVSILDDNDFEARHIMRVSGHKSEASIKSYSRQLTESKQRQISPTLTSVCAQSSTKIVPFNSEVAPVAPTGLEQSDNLLNVQNAPVFTRFNATQEAVHFTVVFPELSTRLLFNGY